MDLFLNGVPVNEQNGKAGFTLLELIVVMVIMSIFLALAFPRLGPQLMSARINACHSDMTAMVNLARFRAVETRQPQRLIIDLDHNLIRASQGDLKTAYMQKKLPKGIACLWVNVNSVSVQNGLAKIIFEPDGTSAHTQIKFMTKNKEVVIFEITGADSQIRML
jgi:general secretion pathway protein H